jgi:hypothetical protein
MSQSKRNFPFEAFEYQNRQLIKFRPKNPKIRAPKNQFVKKLPVFIEK